MHSYLTLSKLSESIYKEKGSKFIGIAFPCDSENDFTSKLKEIKIKYNDSRHHCFAYKLKPDGSQIRFNDDGEPSNSAGKPILGQIEHFKITQVGIVVVRYFGGTKLGVGGLIKAYREAAKEAINNNKIINKEITSFINLNFSYAEMNTIMKLIKDFDLKIKQQQMHLNCEMTLELPIRIKEELCSKLEQHVNIEKNFLD